MDDLDEQVPEADLVEGVRRGDRDAMVELWRRHYPAVLLAARRVTRQPRDAEEIASDAFSGMLSALSTGSGPTTSVRAYLVTSVRNLAASRARRSSSGDVITDAVTLKDLHIRDARLTRLGVSVDCPGTRLAPGAAMDCTSHPYTVTQADVDAGRVLNVATGSGITPRGSVVVSPPSTAVTETDRPLVRDILAFTGSNFVPLVGLGLASILIGAALTVASRRRREHTL